MLDIPLSVVNITVASIMIGTGIDYSIQTTQRMKEEIAKGVSKIEAMKTTIETTGWSVVGAAATTMVALLATFAVNIPILHQFSILVMVSNSAFLPRKSYYFTNYLYIKNFFHRKRERMKYK